ncbi:phage major capsid protein [Rhodovulum marinum]|uniref:HK97 family phage major capsid protein n=1 Tax=Rhodovulum marinum TaxID=320662 RepID=A0A4R2PUR9_9RHOB|nr:phage major capsid protein [Rhodovulum marinum]TCP39803.1 HK97 family phage major capsid protein [Rhodovulum marinum]
MLDSVKIARRQSEIRQALAELVGKDKPTEDETRSMETLDAEYRANETRYRAALIAEDEERREAGNELETRSAQEWAEIMGRFQMRQVALALDEGRQLDGATAEIVSELREKGGYRGVPVPWEALELRAGETVASGTPNPIRTAPIIDRLFAQSAAARMGAQMINIGVGELEYPVTTSSVAAGWADGETASVAGPSVYATTDRPLKPDHTLGITMKITRKALKQTGDALEQAVRRDMNGAISEAMDKAVFLGTGANGQPLGVITGAATYGITATAVDAEATSAAFRNAVARFLTANAATGGGDVRLLARPELWAFMDEQQSILPDLTEWDRLLRTLPAANIMLSGNALAAPTGSPVASSALLTTSAGGVAPVFVGTWGAVDLIRDPYSDATSGGLRLTALTTVDLTVSRPAQLEVLTGLQHQAA